MRIFVALLLSCALLLVSVSGIAEMPESIPETEVNVESQVLGTESETENKYAGFEGMIGHIFFSLPGIPEKHEDIDVQGWWKDSFLLWGHCMSDSAEYQLRSADISEWIESYKEKDPDDEESACFNALVNYALILVSNENYATIKNISAIYHEGDFYCIGADYEYADSPGKNYTAIGYLEKTTAVVLSIDVDTCEHGQTIFSSYFGPASADEWTRYKAREETIVSCYPFQISFPHDPATGRNKNNNAKIYTCLTEDYTSIYMSVPDQPWDISALLNWENEQDLKNAVLNMARSLVAGIDTLDIKESSFHVENGTIDYLFSTSQTESQDMLTRVIAGESGTILLFTQNTDAGLKFLSQFDDLESCLMSEAR